MRKVALVYLTMGLALGLALPGCGGGGEGGGGDDGLKGIADALNVVLPTAGAVTTGDAASVAMIEAWGDAPPTSLGAMDAELDRAVRLAEANPTDAGAQIALCLAMLGWAVNYGSDDLGYDLNEVLETESVMDLEGLVGASLSADLATEFLGCKMTLSGRSATAGVRTADTDGLTPGQVQTVIENRLLRVLSNPGKGIIQRMDALSNVAPGTKLVEYTPDGETFALYPADFGAVAALLRMFHSVLLNLVAYNLDYGDYRWETAAWRSLPVGTAVAPADYLPPTPFFTLRSGGAGRMNDAIDDVRVALAGLGTVMGAVPTDPNDILRRMVTEGGVDTTDLQQRLADLGEIASAGGIVGQLDYVRWVETSDWVEGTPITNIPIKIAALWDDPQSNLRALLPTLHVVQEDSEKTLEVQGPGDFPDHSFGGVFSGAKVDEIIALLTEDTDEDRDYSFTYTSAGGRTYTIHWGFYGLDFVTSHLRD